MSIFVSARPVILHCKEDIWLRRQMLAKKLTSGHRVTTNGIKKNKFRACKFQSTGQTWGKKLKTFDTSGVISDVAAAFETGDVNSVEYKTAVFCGAYGQDHLLRTDGVTLYSDVYMNPPVM